MHRIRIEQNRRKVTRVWIDDVEQQRVLSVNMRCRPYEPMELIIADHPEGGGRYVRERFLPIATLIITVSGAPAP